MLSRHGGHGSCYSLVKMQNLDESAINVFTDGSMKERPRRGGVGWRIVTVGEAGHDEAQDFSPPGYPGETNNLMELMAVILALKDLFGRRPPVELARFNKVVVYTDSRYVHKHLPIARGKWARQGWQRASGPLVVHAQQWKELIRLTQGSPLPVRIEWLPGKSSEHTKAVDKLAKKSAETPLSRPITHATVRRKLTDESVDSGSVPMEGQVLDVRIVVGEYHRLQRCSRYKYEVVSGDLEGAVDWALSQLHLRSGHAFRVRFNDDQADPRILEELGELPHLAAASRDE